MRELLEALLIAGVVGWTATLGLVLWVRHRLRRPLRIDPGRRTSVPTVWLVAPTAPARLHRRLRMTASSARLASACDRELAPLADELVSEAVALEPRVLALVGTRRAGGPGRRDVAARIGELEAVARRLASLSSPPMPAPGSGGNVRLGDRLSAFEAARRELDEIDLRAGLLRH